MVRPAVVVHVARALDGATEAAPAGHNRGGATVHVFLRYVELADQRSRGAVEDVGLPHVLQAACGNRILVAAPCRKVVAVGSEDDVTHPVARDVSGRPDARSEQTAGLGVGVVELVDYRAGRAVEHIRLALVHVAVDVAIAPDTVTSSLPSPLTSPGTET